MALITISEKDDLLQFTKNGDTLNFIFRNIEKYEEVKAYKNKSGFNIIIYLLDDITGVDMGVFKLESCFLFYEKDKTLECSILGDNGEYFNPSEKAKLRKFIINDMLDS